MTTRSFELTDAKSDKFWTISIEGKQHTVNFGRRGTAGQTQTKDFASSDEARQATEKLISEKLKKGYVEVGAAEPVKPVAARPRASGTPAEERKPAAAPPPPARRKPEPAPPPARDRIQLSAADWAIATWRPRPLETKPQPAPFDRARAMATANQWIAAAKKEHWGWWHRSRWGEIDVPGQMTAEEARFWFHAALILDEQFSGRVQGLAPVEERLAAVDVTKDLPFREAARQIDDRFSSLLLIALLNLYPAAEIADAVAAAAVISPAMNIGDECFRARVAPYLSAAERETLRQALERKLSLAPAPAQYGPLSQLFYLAAILGVGADLTQAIERWADGQYEKYAFAGPQVVVFGLPSAGEVSHHMRRLGLRLNRPLYIRGWLAHTELAELDLIQESIAAETKRELAIELTEAFGKAVAAPEAAPVMLSLMVESKAARPAREWLMEHAAETIAGLAPMAAGKGKLAEAAADILRDLHRSGHTAAIEGAVAAEALQKVVPAAPEEVPELTAATTPAGLAAAFAEAAGVKGKLPSWATPAILPAIATVAGRLTLAQMGCALQTLAKSDVALPHPLLLALRCYATPASLDRFAWALFDRWLTDGAPAKEKWALSGLGIFGGDESAMRLAGLIREWPGQGKHQTAVLGLECLRSIGTDTALQLISGIAQKVKFQAIKARAQECMEAIAADMRLTRPQLEDRVAPDCGLDERGSRTFDYGPRQFRLMMGPGLKPLLVDAENHRKPDLPKPNSKDDPSKAEEALAAWKMVKKQIAETGKVQARRLEQALVTQRRWTAEEFDRFFVRHPFLVNLAVSLVWGVYRDGQPALTFRVTEDRSLADEHDAAVTLPADAAIGLVHPIQLAPAVLAKWGELLGDYEIIPPFPQLGRPVHKLTEDEASRDSILRHEGVQIPAASLVGTLERLGWQRSTPADAGGYDNHGKHFAEAGITAIIQHETIFIGSLAESGSVPIEACYFTPGGFDRKTWSYREGSRIPLREIDALILSEVLSDLETVASKGVE